MITSLARYIAVFLFKNNIIDGEKLDIYIYGFEIIISSSINITMAIILGILLSQLVECFIFLISFILLRKYCGGYHASTYLKCNIIFAINIVIVMLALKIGITADIYIHYILCLISIIVFWFFAPVENKYKPLNSDEKKKYRKLAIMIGSFFIFISSVLRCISLSFSVIINMTLISVAVAMVVEILMKGDWKDEEC